MSNQLEANENRRINGYTPTHPWFYVLGGQTQTPKEIRAEVRSSGYKGYRQEELSKLDAKAEPQRSQGLRKLRLVVLEELRIDLRQYRSVALEFHRQKQSDIKEESNYCADVHTSMSLKYCHLFNDFGHILAIDEMLSKQPDLFEGFC